MAGEVATGPAGVVGVGVAAVVATVVGVTAEAAVAEGVAADVVTGVPAYEEGTGLIGEMVAADVGAGVSSSGVGGRGMVGYGTSLAWLAGDSDGLLPGETTVED